MSDEERKGLLARKLFQEVVNDQVSEKLGELTRRIKDLMKKAKRFSEDEQVEVEMMVLGMIREACGDFHTKMVARINGKK